MESQGVPAGLHAYVASPKKPNRPNLFLNRSFQMHIVLFLNRSFQVHILGLTSDMLSQMSCCGVDSSDMLSQIGCWSIQLVREQVCRASSRKQVRGSLALTRRLVHLVGWVGLCWVGCCCWVVGDWVGLCWVGCCCWVVDDWVGLCWWAVAVGWWVTG